MGSSVPLWPMRGDAGRRAHALDDVVGGQAFGLVEEEEVTLLQGVGRRHGSSVVFAAAAGPAARSSSIRAPRSRERSDMKWSSGA